MITGSGRGGQSVRGVPLAIDSLESDVIHPAFGCCGVGLDLDMMLPLALVAGVAGKTEASSQQCSSSFHSPSYMWYWMTRLDVHACDMPLTCVLLTFAPAYF